MQCGRRWMQGGSQALLQACIRDDAAIAPLEVLRIPQLSHSPACISVFYGTLRHLVLPDLSLQVTQGLPAVVAALTRLQVGASWPPPVSAALLAWMRHCYLQRPRLHHARLLH